MPDFSKMSDSELNAYIEKASKPKTDSGLDYLFSAVDAARKSLQSSTLNPATLAFETALREASNPANAQSTINALKMQPATPGADIAGQALNMGIRHGPTIAASMALPGSMAAGPASEAVGGMLGRGLMARGAAGAAGVLAGGAEQAGVAGATQAAQSTLAGRSPEQVLQDALKTGGAFGKAETGLSAVGSIGGALAKNIGPQIMKILPRIPEDIGKQIMNDPSIILRAEPLNVAGEKIGEAASKYGLKPGTEGLQESFGTRFYPADSSKVFEWADSSSNELAAFKKSGDQSGLQDMQQKALSMVQAINHALRRSKFKQPIEAANRRELLKTESEMEGFLSSTAPDIMPALKAYRESIVKDAFMSLFPRNANMTASVLGGLGMGGSIGAGAALGHPGMGMAAAPLFSPLAYGAGIGGAALARKAIAPGTLTAALGAANGQ